VIVVDSSALVAIVKNEPGYESFVKAIDATDRAIMSAANFLEVAIVMLRRFGPTGLERSRRLREASSVELRDVDRTQLDLAIEAYARFGRGMGHPAGLNFGDCFAYALARMADAPLLYKGEDFAKTDIRSAL
jgi:ribonuclease VapC